MFKEIFEFELKFHRRQYLFYVLAGVFFLFAFLATTTPNVSLIGGVGNININSPYTVMMTLSSLSVLTLFAAIAFCASGVVRDLDHGVAELFLSTPVSKRDYIYGRFAGAFVFAFGIYMAGALGVFVGEFMPWLDQERIGPVNVGAYWFSTWAIALPNLFVCSSLLFLIATITRSMMWTYVGMVVLLMLTFVLDTFQERDLVELTSILDPFGATALEQLTRYWTVFERNAQVPPLEGALLANRLLWVVLGMVFLGAVYPLSRFTLDPARTGRRRPKLDESVVERRPADLKLAPVTLRFDGVSVMTQYLSQTKLEVRNIVRSVPFIVLLLLGLFNVVGNAIASLGNIFGTAVLPSTSILVMMINGAFSLSLLAVMFYYAGELMVRERVVKVAEIMDALPWPNAVMIAAKITGLVLVVVAMLLVAMLAAIGVQLYSGFYDIDVAQYLLGLLFFFQFPLYLMIVMAVFFYVLTRNKYASMALMIVYVIMMLALPQMGLEHYLYRPSQLGVPYSDFTGFSHNLVPHLWQTLYWGLFGCLLLLVIHLLWPRGSEDDWANRIKVMRGRMTRGIVVAGWAVATLFALTGSWIYYNTAVVNDYVTNLDREAASAEYEKTYKQYEDLPMPSVTDVYAEVDIFPSRQEVTATGRYTLRNEESASLDIIHLVLQPYIDIKRLAVEGATITNKDEDFGYFMFEFDTPLAPGEERRLDFEVAWLTPGFANSGHSPKLAKNGTFFNNGDLFPAIGYRDDFELQDNNTRREHDLPPVERMAPIDDESHHDQVGFGSTNRVDFETIVSTSPDQIAIAPGYLQDEWEEDGRRYFHYRMDAPIWNFFSFMSADYEVARDEWNDVAIEVYYLHDYNVERMIESVQDSLDYFTENFSPYQYRQFRIMEFPRFQGVFAQSFPNTIPYSEAIGFTADLRDPKDIDYVYYVTAHELAHQWWAHQVIGANVQGQTMIVETLAQYSALMVMKAKYGEAYMKRFLEFEMDRYLQGRGGELIDELPLYLVENQPYIHYRKGSVVLYALQDYIGEEKINLALSRFIDDYAFRDAPYPTTLDLIEEIRAVAGEQHQALITDLLERIVLYDLRVVDASVNARDDGRFEVTIDVSAAKLEATGGGEESEVPLTAWIDVGVLGPKSPETDVPSIIHLERYEVVSGEQQFMIVVDEEPVSVGIDPLNKLIDRDPSDNITTI